MRTFRLNPAIRLLLGVFLLSYCHRRLHEITVRLASFVGDASKKDGLIALGGVAAFIQTVLVPELGVRLIMEDMNVREAKARIILDESREIGEKLNMDEFTEDIYDEEDGPWFDINAKTAG